MLMKNHYASTVDLNDAEFLQAEKHMYYFYNTFKEIEKFIANTAVCSNISLDINISFHY